MAASVVSSEGAAMVVEERGAFGEAGARPCVLIGVSIVSMFVEASSQTFRLLPLLVAVSLVIMSADPLRECAGATDVLVPAGAGVDCTS